MKEDKKLRSWEDMTTFRSGHIEDAGRLIGFRSPIVRATIDKYTKDIAVSSQGQLAVSGLDI